MRALIQRVTGSKLYIDNKVYSQISAGYVILLGVTRNDHEKTASLLAEKTVNLRIMSDNEDKMNLSILDKNGEILVVSQFTLYADLTAGRRPSFLKSAEPEIAEKLYSLYIDELRHFGVKKVATGKFGAYMKVEIHNDGPVTILLDSDEFKKN